MTDPRQTAVGVMMTAAPLMMTGGMTGGDMMTDMMTDIRQRMIGEVLLMMTG